jgi:hypothetical protein
VIREVLKVHKAVIQNRDHWRRTAQAVLALYAPAEDVFAVAQERESDRNNISHRPALSWKWPSVSVQR